MKQHFELPNITIEDLMLRRLVEKDAPDLFECTSDPDVTRYVFWQTHHDMTQTKQFIRFLNSDEISSCAIFHSRDNKVIGTCFFHSFHPIHKKVEMAFNISKKYWGRGYATISARALVQYVFQNWDINRIEGTCMLDNITSARVLEKVGMQFEGIMRKSHLRYDGFFDMKLYAVLRLHFGQSSC